MHRLSNALILCGLLILGYAGAWQVGLVPGSRTSLPYPVVLERAGVGVREVSTVPTTIPAPVRAVAQVATPIPVTVPVPTLPAMPPATPAAPRLAPVIVADAADRIPSPPPLFLNPTVVADAADRIESAQLPPPGYAVRLAIPSIKLDTVVKQGGIVQDDQGVLAWETMPFVAVHYGDLTALVGARGNAVIAGHVVTLREGNVFRFLYKVNIDDQVQVWDDNDREHDFQVVDVKLVPPTDTAAMAPTFDRTLTLITCGGTFDPIKREFSDRLIVTAKEADLP